MISRYDAIIDGVALSTFHDQLMVLDIGYPSGQRQNTLSKMAKGHGYYLTDKSQSQISVVVSFELHIYDPMVRNRVCQQIAEWAMKGSILETSDRPDQRLHIVCDQPPTIASARGWTEPIEMVFTAYELPFWEETHPAILNLTGNTEGNVYVPGNADDALVDAQITCTAAISDITIRAGQTSITLTGISVPAGGVINISHDEDMILAIKYGNTSLLSKRTGSDYLMVPSGERSTFSISASGATTTKFMVRGLWL